MNECSTFGHKKQKNRRTLNTEKKTEYREMSLFQRQEEEFQIVDKFTPLEELTKSNRICYVWK
jgi:hypothetical protein